MLSPMPEPVDPRGARFAALWQRGEIALARGLLYERFDRWLVVARRVRGSGPVPGVQARDAVHEAIETALHRGGDFDQRRGALDAWVQGIVVLKAREQRRASAQSAHRLRLVEPRSARPRDPLEARDLVDRVRLELRLAVRRRQLTPLQCAVLEADLEAALDGTGRPAPAESLARRLGVAVQTVLNQRSLARKRMEHIRRRLFDDA